MNKNKDPNVFEVNVKVSDENRNISNLPEEPEIEKRSDLNNYEFKRDENIVED